jgi:hypothetical protein
LSRLSRLEEAVENQLRGDSVNLFFSLFLSVTSVTSVTMEENQIVVVSRLCPADTSKRDRRDKLEGWLCRGAIDTNRSKRARAQSLARNPHHDSERR